MNEDALEKVMGAFFCSSGDLGMYLAWEICEYMYPQAQVYANLMKLRFYFSD